MHRLLPLLVILTLTFVSLAPLPAVVATAEECGFVLGFATLHGLIADTVGNCVDNVAYASNGDGIQHTTNGSLVWRQSDNFTAFTDGYRTSVNGPRGVEQRLNSQRFSWEENPDGLPVVSNGLALSEASSQLASSDAVTTDRVNLREGPGTSYGVISVLPSGQRLTILGKSGGGDWDQVRTSGGASGWVSASFVSTSLSSAGVSSTSAAPTRLGSASVTALGDSVMLGAVGALQDALLNVEVDASVSRQAWSMAGVVRAHRDGGSLGSVVVIHTGTNGPMSASTFDDIMQAAGSSRKVVFVNLKVPRDWEAQNNAVISAGVNRYANAVLVDWHSASSGRSDFFWDDGIHLRPAGARAFASLIAAAAGN